MYVAVVYVSYQAAMNMEDSEERDRLLAIYRNQYGMGDDANEVLQEREGKFVYQLHICDVSSTRCVLVLCCIFVLTLKVLNF